MNPSLTITRLPIAAPVLFALSGCDLQEIGNQATAKTVAVEVKGGAIAGNGFDAGLTGFDVGLLNLALAFFGKRQLVAQTCTALVALGDAHVGAGSKADAKASWERALATPLGKRDMSLLADLEQRISDLEDS